jgi:ABC-type glycerol-3-phosphate transport system permease component
VLAANFTVYFKNSIIVSLTAVAFIIIVASMAGYAFSKLRFKWNQPCSCCFWSA